MPYNKTGVFCVASDLYLPIRGNGWYSHVMASYLMDKQLIKSTQIKYAVHRSLRVPSGYLNELIDAIYAIEDGYEKFKIKCMAGLFKPSKNDRFRTIAVSSDPSVVYYHYLQTKASFIDSLRVGEAVYYHLRGKYHSRAEESETPHVQHDARDGEHQPLRDVQGDRTPGRHGGGREYGLRRVHLPRQQVALQV